MSSASVSSINSSSGIVTPPVAPVSFLHAPIVSAAPLHNPRVVQDPRAGFITEYLNANGTQIVSQTPSAISVAYLRLGLAADGTKRVAATTA